MFMYFRRVTGQPSSKTDFVVLGDNAGPSKIKAIQKNNLKTLSEDEFLDLIGTRIGPSGKGGAELDEKMRKKMEKEEQAIRDTAKEMEKREKQMSKAIKHSGTTARPGTHLASPENKLWTDRYAPQSLKEICGNKGQIEKLQQWLHDWYILASLLLGLYSSFLSIQGVESRLRVQETR
jgi:replication factor C subunit 1